MSYYEALEAAGAEVLLFKAFGSYQGTWWAKVLDKGKQYWVSGAYGSCSGCDAFQAEFGYDESEACNEHRYEYPKPDISTCKACAEARESYNKHLSEFGGCYLANEYTQKEAEEYVSKNIEWDFDAREELAFIQDNKLEEQ